MHSGVWRRPMADGGCVVFMMETGLRISADEDWGVGEIRNCQARWVCTLRNLMVSYL